VVLALVCLAGTACGGAPADTNATGDCVRSRPRIVRGLSAGERYSLAVLENGDALLWGEVLSYMGGEGKPHQMLVPPVSVDTGCRRTVEVAAGWWHACVRIDGGEVRCWGRNDAGQLGITGNTTRSFNPPRRPASVLAVPPWRLQQAISTPALGSITASFAASAAASWTARMATR
jgi:alpha-tubulin suppressor-like RCC1 family protein